MDEKECGEKMKRLYEEIRKLLLFLLLCMAVLAMAGCGGASGKDETEKMLEKGMEAAARMKEYASSDVYRALVAGPSSDTDEMWDTVKTAYVSSAKSVYEITADSLLLIEEQLGYSREDYNKLSDVLKDRLKKQAIAGLPSIINAKRGVQCLAFAGSVSDGGSFLLPSLKEHRILVFVFERGYPLWVGFFPEGEGIVSYQAQWLVLDGTTITTESALSEALDFGQQSALKVRKVK